MGNPQLEAVVNTLLDFDLVNPNYPLLAENILNAVPMISAFKTYLLNQETSILKIANLNITTFKN